MKKIAYFFAAITLLVIITPLAISSNLITYILHPKSSRKNFNTLLFTISLSIDAFGNVLLSSLFNRLFITNKGYPYGNWHETISQVTGENHINKTLTKQGERFRFFLDIVFGKDHCEKAVRSKKIRAERYLNRLKNPHI